MAYQSPNVISLREEEGRCLKKFKDRAAQLEVTGLSKSAAFQRALNELPKAYASLQHVRRELSLLGVSPQLLDEV